MTEAPAPPPTATSGASSLLARLGPNSVDRPTPTLPAAVFAAAGALVAFGVLFLVGGDGDSRGVVALAGAIVAIAGFAVLFLAPRLFQPAGVTMLAIGTVYLWQGVFIGDDSGTGAINGALLLGAFTLLALYLVTPKTTGHTPLLGVALLLLWQVALNTVNSDQASFLEPNIFGNGSQDVAWTSLVVAGVYVAIMWQLDLRERRGAGTAFAAIGGIALIFTIFTVIPSGLDTLSSFGSGSSGSAVFLSLFLMVVSVGIGHLGNLSERRFTTWMGGVGFFAGAFALAVAIIDDNARGAGAIMLVLGLLAAAALYFIMNDPDGMAGIKAKLVDAANRDDEAAAPPPPAPGAPTDAPPTASTAPAPPTVAPSTAAADIDPAASYSPDWYPDPHGRFEQRYHDGAAWTAHVARDGEQFTDPDGV